MRNNTLSLREPLLSVLLASWLVLAPFAAASAEQTTVPGPAVIRQTEQAPSPGSPTASSSPVLSAVEGSGRIERQHKLYEGLFVTGLLAIPFDDQLTRSTAHDTGKLTDFFNHFGEATFLAPILAGTYYLGDTRDKETARLAAVALVNAAAVTQGLKLLTGRGRPTEEDAGDFTGPTTESGMGSFPSGHTSAAFAVATVYAERHPKRKWLYYGLAAAVAVARVDKSKHFPSDVLVGAAVGVHEAHNALYHRKGLLSFRF